MTNLRTLGVSLCRTLSLLGIAVIAVACFALPSSSNAASVDLQLSSTRATAHPDARITVASDSFEAMQSARLKLPNGMWASLAAATKCAYATAQSGGCAATSQIGAVTVHALVDDSDIVLRGKAYLTTPAPAKVASDPAGIAFVMPVAVGGVNLGRLVVNARALMRNADVPGGGPQSVGALEGFDVLFENLPTSHTDQVSGRTVGIKVNSLAIDLTSDLDGPRTPLLTNPSVCGPATMAASIANYSGGTASMVDSAPEAISDCETTAFDPSFDTSVSDPSAGSATGLLADVVTPADNATLKSVQLKMPPILDPNVSAFGTAADQCDPASAVTSETPFIPALCPPQAKVGKIVLETPMLPGAALIGNVYLINKLPVPWLGIDISPTTAASNPKGVTIRLVAQTAMSQVDPSCNPLTTLHGVCETQLVVSITNLPDLPVTDFQLDLNVPNRIGSTGATLSGKLLKVGAAPDFACQPKDEFTVSLLNKSENAIRGDRVSTQSFAGCNSRAVSIDDGVGSAVGKTTTNAVPAIPFSGGSNHTCFFDLEAGQVPCVSPVAPSAPLSKDVHRINVIAGGQNESRAFAVASDPATPDTTAPTTGLSPPGATIADATPTFSFTANEPSSFQCAIAPGSDPSALGAFLACDPSAANSTSGSFTVAAANALIAGKTYTVAVRAQDAAGNVDLTPATATFVVDVPFSAGLDYQLNSFAARANPDLDLTISNSSHEDIRDFELKLPNGLFAGLTGAAVLCPATGAATGDCPAGAQIGTVEADAGIDESTLRMTGPIYLTDPLQPGDAAGLAIKLPAQLGAIKLGENVMLTRVNVRGQAEGLDTLTVQVPNHVNPATAGNNLDADTAFDLRRITLKLRTNPGASYPLLTNASSCIPRSFKATVVGNGGSISSPTSPYAVTDCDSLPFNPTLQASIVKEGSNQPPAFGDNVQLSATVTSNASDSALKNVAVTMPAPISIDIKKMGLVCEPEQYAAGACPDGALVGGATAISPLLFTPLTGPVYLLRAVPPLATPRLLIELRGVVSVDIIGVNRFINGSQIQSAFTELPDVPFTSFNMTIGRLLSVAYDPCDSSPNNSMQGLMVAHNSKSVSVSSKLAIKRTCAEVKVKAKGALTKGKKAKFKITQTASGARTIKYSVKLPRGASFIKAAAKRKIVVTADGKKVLSKCFKVSKSTLTIGFCGKKVGKLTVTAKPGSILVTKTINRPKLKITQVDTDKKVWHRTATLK